ncbi:DUF4430 domain-containing protein [Faecalispora anaeroviscerum]|uniref:DUF4430 domain-containing protein n=1 Tax=Faecalispora anaeroviscerum TaxID=2991836 RepID=UPI0024BA773B|nr:DUF4430 domain-containing protein [Faecalispora anaeroviscerum]
MNEDQKGSRRSTSTAIIIFVVAAIVLSGMWWFFSPRGTTGNKDITITLTNQQGSSRDYKVSTDAEYLKEAAESVLTLGGKDSKQGFAVYSINGETADFEKTKAYWAIYVNGAYGKYSVDKQPVTDGDTYAFVYESY